MLTVIEAPLQDYVLAEEAARILGVKVRSVYRDRYTSRNYPQAIKVGRTLMWRRDELEAYRRRMPFRARVPRQREA